MIKVGKSAGGFSIPVRVTNIILASAFVERTRGFSFYLILPYGSYMGLIFSSSILWLSEVLCGLLGGRVFSGLVSAVVCGEILIKTECIDNRIARLRLKLLEHMTVN